MTHFTATALALRARRLAITVLFLLSYWAAAQVLYDPSLGTAPGHQDWMSFALGNAAETLTNNAVQLDTTLAAATYAGYSRILTTPLNYQDGFILRFSARLESETHTKTNRAGFSVILLADNKRGIELGFWTNEIFAQADSPLFARAEGTTFPTVTSFVDYALSIRTSNYVLRANGAPILSGPVRDYTSFVGSLNPYSTPNYIFFGDDTTPASAAFSLRQIALIPAPRLVIRQNGLVCWQAVSNQTYTLQASTNLSDWTDVGIAISASADLCFTNDLTLPQRFYRLSFP